ncbi:hypothetical protein [Streptomyces sp. NRRL B-3648]|uniref:hypothetical protein n=1 Tax=Streptomyces sp. NRRL B-3648 TaxID=1519493 RepID=UPI00099C6332|nr:hypothetical protein [Streptomyces sp. NRRL B-3648]
MSTLTKSAVQLPPMSLRVGKATAKTAKAAPAWSLRLARSLGAENAVDLLVRQHRQIKLGFLPRCPVRGVAATSTG